MSACAKTEQLVDELGEGRLLVLTRLTRSELSLVMFNNLCAQMSEPIESPYCSIIQLVQRLVTVGDDPDYFASMTDPRSAPHRVHIYLQSTI